MSSSSSNNPCPIRKLPGVHNVRSGRRLSPTKNNSNTTRPLSRPTTTTPDRPTPCQKSPCRITQLPKLRHQNAKNLKRRVESPTLVLDVPVLEISFPTTPEHEEYDDENTVKALYEEEDGENVPNLMTLTVTATEEVYDPPDNEPLAKAQVWGDGNSSESVETNPLDTMALMETATTDDSEDCSLLLEESLLL